MTDQSAGTAGGRPVGVAVLGTGAIAREHVRILAAHPGVRVVAVVGSDEKRAAQVAALAPGAAAGTDPGLALNDSQVDAVDVCGVTDSHPRWTIAAGVAGKHVHVEKPAALTLPDFDAMVAAVHGAGRTLMVGQTVRFQPVIRALRRQLIDGRIGTPRLLHVTWYVGHVWPGGWRAWQFDPTRSGGHPVHNGSHSIDLATWLIGRQPVRVFARSFQGFASDMPVPDSFHVTLRFDDDSLALLDISYALRRPGEQLRRVVLAGTRGTLSHHSADDPGLESAAGVAAPQSIDNALASQLHHWVEVVSGRAEPIVAPGQVRSALSAALAAQRSLETGEPVTLAVQEHAQGAPR